MLIAAVIYLVSMVILMWLLYQNTKRMDLLPTFGQSCGHAFVILMPVLNTATVLMVAGYAARRAYHLYKIRKEWDF